MNQFSKYLLELLVITLSVFAAFWLENIREDRREKRQQLEALQHILIEMKTNKDILEGNIEILREFNETYQVVDSLVGPLESEVILSREELDMIRSRHAGNSRIQELGIEIEDSKYRIDSESVNIDFFLQRMNFGMWESAKASGILIGVDKDLVQNLFYIYSAFETEFGFTEEDYHSALIQDLNSEFINVSDVVNATYRLEQGFKLKNIVLNGVFDDVVERTEKYLDVKK